MLRRDLVHGPRVRIVRPQRDLGRVSGLRARRHADRHQPPAGPRHLHQIARGDGRRDLESDRNRVRVLRVLDFEIPIGPYAPRDLDVDWAGRRISVRAYPPSRRRTGRDEDQDRALALGLHLVILKKP